MTIPKLNEDETQEVERLDGSPISDKSKIWASSMAGATDGKFTRAHGEIAYIPFEGGQSVPVLPNGAIYDLQARLDFERTTLSKSATLSTPGSFRALNKLDGISKSANSPIGELALRTRFEHDRDRIKHFEAFRRLANKTQVHLVRSDHQRTRLTHTLEVEQIAVSISTALRLNTALTSAIALGHDCGHGPGGHASEDALDPYLVGGFNHALFGANVTLAPLNLCFETLDGIRNHSWSLDKPLTPEAEVVAFADRIAYVCHDLEDALSCQMVSSFDYPKDISGFLNKSRGTQIDFFIRAVIEGTIQSESIAMIAEFGEILAAMRSFNLEKVYRHPISEKANVVVIQKLRDLVEYLAEHPEKLPNKTLNKINDGQAELLDSVVEYVAGMTDNFAYRLHSELIMGRRIASYDSLFMM